MCYFSTVTFFDTFLICWFSLLIANCICFSTHCVLSSGMYAFMYNAITLLWYVFPLFILSAGSRCLLGKLLTVETRVIFRVRFYITGCIAFGQCFVVQYRTLRECIGGKSFSFTMTVLIVFTSFLCFLCVSTSPPPPPPLAILPLNLLPTPCYKMGFLVTCVKVYIPRRITVMEQPVYVANAQCFTCRKEIKNFKTKNKFLCCYI